MVHLRKGKWLDNVYLREKDCGLTTWKELERRTITKKCDIFAIEPFMERIKMLSIDVWDANNIKGRESKTLDKLKSLEHLELHFNKQDALFKKIIFGLFQTATSDEFKCEGTNMVSKFPEFIFKHLTKLKELKLVANVVNSNDFKGLENLETLVLKGGSSLNKKLALNNLLPLWSS